MPRVTISEPGKTPQPYRFKLERKTINIGRGSENDIVVECASVSTHHSTMERIDGGYILRDTGSTNGIKQDDTLMEIIDLYDGMEILVGDIPLRFELSKEEISQLSEEDYTSHQKKKLPSVSENDDVPARKPRTVEPAQPHPSIGAPPMASASPGMSPLLVLLLMAAAVFSGMVLRHYKDHDKFMLSEAKEVKEEGKPSEDGTKTPTEAEKPAN